MECQFPQSGVPSHTQCQGSGLAALLGHLLARCYINGITSNQAVCHGLPFSIGMKVEDFRRFKPEEVSGMDCIVGKPTTAIEAPFAYTVQGTLHTYYMSCISNIIR